MIRCCLCRELPRDRPREFDGFERTDLPGSGYRCVDHDACSTRVAKIIAAHVSLAEALR